MLILFTLAFCQWVMALLFLLSSGNKLLHFRTFQQTVANFQLVSPRFVSSTAALILCCELTIAVFMLLGQAFLFPGFMLATLLLLLFTAAMISILKRHMVVACNCFGTHQTPIQTHTIGRNIGFLCIALLGAFSSLHAHTIQEPLNAINWIIVAFAAATFVLIWLQLHEIKALFISR